MKTEGQLPDLNDKIVVGLVDLENHRYRQQHPGAQAKTAKNALVGPGRLEE